MRERFSRLASSAGFQGFITGVIVFAGVLVGLETSLTLVAQHGPLLHLLDKVVLGIFVLEIVVKVGAEGRRPWRFFKDGWNVFDFAIVVTSLLPVAGQHLLVLRLARLLRVLRLVHALPRLQVLVTALIKSFPSMGYVSLLLGLLFYVYGVAGTFLFAANDPVHFGNLGTSLLTLFRIVTLEGWSELLYIQMRGCAAIGYDGFPQLCTASAAQPVAGVVFFTSFILLGTMIVLNLFIGVIMNGMTEANAEVAESRAEAAGALTGQLERMEKTLTELQLQLARLRGTAVELEVVPPPSRKAS